ncbi:MAG: alpha/beta hydrolase [Bacteroidetes bacterium]|nr:alpha/beta hydrolase [Bacteroidota bacterium]MBS1740347.1 alpha/beta hydrolase [Bacteroidota bacterium]
MKSNQISTTNFPKLSYTISGSETAPALILLHGFPESGTLWQKIAPSLSKDFLLVIPDLPGSGNSELGQGKTNMEQLSEGVKQILDAENISKAVIVGHSMGGYVSLAFAELYPSYVQGLSLVHSTAVSDTEEKKENRRKAIALIQKGGKEAFVRGMVPNLFSDTFKKLNPKVIEAHIETGIKLKAESMIAFYEAMLVRPMRTSALKQATHPVQWIIGKYDNLIPTESALQQCSLAQVNFVSLYAESGHMSMIECPHLLERDLKDFTLYCFNC